MHTTLTVARAFARVSTSRLALVALALGLLVPAALVGQEPTITACVVPLSGTVYIASGACAKNTHTALSWNVYGLQGEKGDKGDKGNTGNQGIQGIPGVSPVKVWAVVNEASVVIKSSAGITLVRQAAGLYRLATTPDIWLCSPSATIGFTSPSNNPQNGMIAVAITETNQVSVSTFDASGAFADKPFVVSVTC